MANDDEEENTFDVARRFGALSLTAVVTAGLGISSVKVVEEMTGYATSAALGLFVHASRDADLTPDGDVYTVVRTEAVHEGAATKPSLTLYRCTTPGAAARGRSVFDALAASDGFGQITYQVVTFEGDGATLFSGLTTLVYDPALTERDQIPTIWAALPSHEAIQVLPNASGRSKWFLSLFVC